MCQLYVVCCLLSKSGLKFDSYISSPRAMEIQLAAISDCASGLGKTQVADNLQITIDIELSVQFAERIKNEKQTQNHFCINAFYRPLGSVN